MAASERRVPDWMSTQACSRAHFEVVSSLAFEARALSSFSKFSCVRRGSVDDGMMGAGLPGDLVGFLGAIVADCKDWKLGKQLSASEEENEVKRRTTKRV
jgi:hypothetical protein